MLVTPYGLGLGIAGTDPQTPQLMSVTPFAADTAADWSTRTASGLTPATGNLVVVLAARSNAASPNAISVTWAGDAVTEIAEADFDAVGGAHVWAGYIKDGVPEMGDLVVTADTGGAKHRDLIGWLLAFDQIAGSPVGATYTYAARLMQAAQPVTLNVTNARSCLIGFVGVMDESLHPMTLSGTGWALQGTNRTGIANTGDIGAAVATKAATATGIDTATLTARVSGGSPLSTDDWCAVGIELLPY